MPPVAASLAPRVVSLSTPTLDQHRIERDDFVRRRTELARSWRGRLASCPELIMIPQLFPELFYLTQNSAHQPNVMVLSAQEQRDIPHNISSRRAGEVDPEAWRYGFSM